jgi:hypothetical protein
MLLKTYTMEIFANLKKIGKEGRTLDGERVPKVNAH